MKELPKTFTTVHHVPAHAGSFVKTEEEAIQMHLQAVLQ